MSDSNEVLYTAVVSLFCSNEKIKIQSETSRYVCSCGALLRPLINENGRNVDWWRCSECGNNTLNNTMSYLEYVTYNDTKMNIEIDDELTNAKSYEAVRDVYKKYLNTNIKYRGVISY